MVSILLIVENLDQYLLLIVCVTQCIGIENNPKHEDYTICSCCCLSLVYRLVLSWTFELVDKSKEHARAIDVDFQQKAGLGCSIVGFLLRAHDLDLRVALSSVQVDLACDLLVPARYHLTQSELVIAYELLFGEIVDLCGIINIVDAHHHGLRLLEEIVNVDAGHPFWVQGVLLGLSLA